MRTYLEGLFAIAWKDLLLELRTRERMSAMGAFAVLAGVLFSYAIDHLQPTQNPPGVNGVIDFNEGGRIICELTDCEPDKVEVGMPVEMTFRKMFRSRGINNYFWKAKPVSD